MAISQGPQGLLPRPDAAKEGGAREALRGLFSTRKGLATLDRLLERLHANTEELLVALQRPDIPLHTDGSENDIRCHVTKR